MRLHIFLAKPNRAGNTVSMTDFGDARNQPVCRTLRQEFDLQIAADTVLLQQLAQFVIVRHKQRARAKFMESFQDMILNIVLSDNSSNTTKLRSEK